MVVECGMGKRVVVVGAGTEIGKTHVGCLLLRALGRRGDSWVGIKPVESGVAPGELRRSDAARLARAAGHELQRPRYLFVEPISPHLAARRSDILIDLEEVAGWVGGHGERNLVVETAGGLMSPLGPGVVNLDLLERCQPDGVVVVASDRLGVLHDVTCVMAMLKARVPALIDGGSVLVTLNAPAQADGSSGTNAEEVVTLGVATSVVAVPRAPLDDAKSDEVGDRLAVWCEGLAPGTLVGLGSQAS